MSNGLAKGTYYQELRAQIVVNEEQLDELEDRLFIERVKAIFYLALGFVILAILIAIVLVMLSGSRFEIMERYSTLVNIGAIFLFFGFIEVFSFFISAFSLIREIRRLIRRHVSALEDAKSEFASA